MKVYIMALAIIVVFTGFFVYQVDSDKYTEFEIIVKSTANDAADAAALYYEKEYYSQGVKVFNKEEGNKAAINIIKNNLGVNDDMLFKNNSLKGKCQYCIYYIDEIGKFTRYDNGILTESKDIGFPFQLVEEKTGYSISINEATTIVTIDAGGYTFNSDFIGTAPLVRSSSYEHVGE